VEVLIVPRYKKREMSWRSPGSNAPLRLRLLKANGDREVYWRSHRSAFARQAEPPQTFGCIQNDMKAVVDQQ
jgi:hypothetical protein